MYCVDFAKNVLFGRCGIIARHDGWRLGCFSTKNTPIVLDTITNSTVYEPLARSDHYLKERLSLTVLGSRLDNFLLSHDHDISTCRPAGLTKLKMVQSQTSAVHILVVTMLQFALASWTICVLQALSVLRKLRWGFCMIVLHFAMYYSETSNNGLSKRQTTSVQWTKSMPPIALLIEIVHLEPTRSRHLSTPDNGQPACPQRTTICTK